MKYWRFWPQIGSGRFSRLLESSGEFLFSYSCWQQARVSKTGSKMTLGTLPPTLCSCGRKRWRSPMRGWRKEDDSAIAFRTSRTSGTTWTIWGLFHLATRLEVGEGQGDHALGGPCVEGKVRDGRGSVAAVWVDAGVTSILSCGSSVEEAMMASMEDFWESI